MIQDNNPSTATQREYDGWNIISRLSHTFRTPLNHVLGFAEILASGSFGPLNEKQTKYVARIQAAGRRQLRLLDQLVDVARVNTRELVGEATPYDVQSMIENVVRQHKSIAKGTGVEIAVRFCDAIQINGDFNSTYQVIDNLIEFAVKRSTSGSTIRVTAILLDDPTTGSQSLGITIVHDGPALSKIEQDLLEHGAPAVGTDQLQDVEGLGLLHASTMARHLGGELSLGTGSGGLELTFTVPTSHNVRLSHALD